MRNWKVPSPVFSTSLWKFKLLKRLVTFKAYPRSLRPSEPERKFQSCHPPLHELYELWIKQKIHYIFFQHTPIITDLFTAFALIHHHTGRWLKAILPVQKKTPWKSCCFSVYLDSCKDRKARLLLTVFLWHMVLNTQLVISHTINGILNYVFYCLYLCAYSWKKHNAP